MKRNIFRIISELRLYRLLQKAPAPRWVVFSLDMLIVAMVSLMVFLFRPFGVSDTSQLHAYCLFISMYAFMNLATGTYRGIVRLSVPYDLFKVFQCVLLASAGICVTSAACSLLSPSSRPLIGILPVFLIGSMVMSLMMTLRIVVKYLFTHLGAVVSKREKVIILGTSMETLALAMTLRDEPNGRFWPVALLSLDDKHKKSKMQGLPVENINPQKPADTFARHNADTLVFLHTQTPLMRSGLAEHFMNAGIRLKVINQTAEFNMDDENEPASISAHVNAVKIEDLLGRQVITTDSSRVRTALKDSTVLITGAAGSIGSEIVRQVAASGAKTIVLLDQAETPMHDMQLEMEASWPDTETVLYVADVQNKKRLSRAFEKYRPQYVFHAAAYKHVPMMERNPSEAILTNVMGTMNLADLSLQWGVRRFVMVSTDKAVNPTNIMGASKRIAEIYVQSLFFHARLHADGKPVTQFITTRFGNVLGSNGSVIPLFRRQIEAGGPLTVTHRDMIRYFMTIKEACSLVLEAGCMGHGGEIFLFDMGKPVKIHDLARRMIMLAGLRPGEDIKIVETGLRPGEKLYEELLNDKETTLPTDNDKIMIAKVREYDYMTVLPHINDMIDLAADGNIHDLVKTMKELVPEYVSNNSVFQSIDREMGHTSPVGKENRETASKQEKQESKTYPPRMNHMNIKHLAASLVILATPAVTHAWDIKDLLNKAGEAVSSVQGSDISDAVGGIVNGLFTKSDLEVKDLAGTWSVMGSAVCFQSDNFLQKAGGSATASIVESKLDPYYQRYGLTGSTLTIAEDGTFTLQMKKLKLSGTVTKQEAKKGQTAQGGNFYFNFNRFGVTSLGNVNTYVTKSPDGLDVMFDASKLQTIMSSVASFSKIQMAQTATDLLNQYDGICIGFHLGKQTLTGK